MSEQSGDGATARAAAYSELVTALLDLRSPAATAAFDQAVAAAVADGQVSPDLARELRWLQRQTVRAVVDHAAAVLPATLVAMERQGLAHVDADLSPESLRVPPEAPAGASTEPPAETASSPAPEQAFHAPPPTTPGLDPQIASPEQASDPVDEQPIDLTARRLLVAGLRPIDDPPFP